MAQAKFKFTLQPALDRLAEQKRECEIALQRAKDELEAAQALLKRLETELDEIARRTEAAHAKFAKPAPRTGDAVRHHVAHLEGLNQSKLVKLQQISGQRVTCDQCRVAVQDRATALSEAESNLKAMERLRDRQLEDFKKLQERAEQNRIDDAATQRFGRR